MSQYFPDAAFALFLWWFSTGFVLYLNGLPTHTFRRSFSIASVLAIVAVLGLAWSASQVTVFAAYVSFGCGLLMYAWQELSYYMGIITGPRKTACETGCSGWPHFVHALQVIIYHEAAVLAGGVLVVFLSWNAPNQVGMWTYLLLWIMQLSAKLNVFLGVRNLSEEFLPTHMQYLRSFLKRRSMNAFFPISIASGTAAMVWLMQQTLSFESGSFEAVGWTFLTSMMVLAVLEHWFLVIPLNPTTLWSWWLELRDRALGVRIDKKKKSDVNALAPTGSGLLRAPSVVAEGGDGIDKNNYLLRSHEH